MRSDELAGRATEHAQGFFDLGMYVDAWTALDDLPAKDKSNSEVLTLRLDILLALHRFDDAVAFGTGACRQFPQNREFFLKTASALIELSDHEKARTLLLAGPATLKGNADYWFDLARCHAALEDVKMARECIGKCFDLDKTFRQRALDELALKQVWEL